MDKYVEFSQVAGKTIKTMVLFTSPEFRAVTLRFDDNTDLTLEIRLGFTANAVYSDWKTGSRRVIKRWPPVRGEP